MLMNRDLDNLTEEDDNNLNSDSHDDQESSDGHIKVNTGEQANMQTSGEESGSPSAKE